jgi:hypothetical protein
MAFGAHGLTAATTAAAFAFATLLLGLGIVAGRDHVLSFGLRSPADIRCSPKRGRSPGNPFQDKTTPKPPPEPSPAGQAVQGGKTTPKPPQNNGKFVSDCP